MAVVLVAVAVQVLHHCTALESGGIEPGSAPVYCVICMSAQVAVLAVSAVVFAVTSLAAAEPPPYSERIPEVSLGFALYVRPPPTL